MVLEKQAEELLLVAPLALVVVLNGIWLTGSSLQWRACALSGTASDRVKAMARTASRTLRIRASIILVAAIVA